MLEKTSAAHQETGWRALLTGGNAVHSLVLSGGVALHALNIYVVTTIMPSIVREIGGLEYYAWSTTVFVAASILGAALSARLLGAVGAGGAYAIGALVFGLGTLLCAAALDGDAARRPRDPGFWRRAALCACLWRDP